MSEFYGPTDDEQSIATIHRALDLGVTLLDTSDVYGPCTNEQLVGDAPSPAAATRSCSPPSSASCASERRAAASTARRSTCARACDASLRRLGVDHIDLYYLHRATPTCRSRRPSAPWPSSSTQGKVRYLGLSEVSADTLRARRRRAPDRRAAERVVAVDPRHRGGDRAERCRELGVGIVAYQPARARLPHRRDTQRRRLRATTTSAATSRASRARTSRPTSRLVERGARARRRTSACTPGQLALAWVLAPG